MHVENIMPVAVKRLIVIGADAALSDAAKRLCERQKALLVVCDVLGVMCGVITKTDIVRQVASGHCNLAAAKTADVMTKAVTYCRPSDSLHDVLAMMKVRQFVHIPVVENRARPIGVVNLRDALQVLFSELKEEELLLREYVMGMGYH